MTKVCLVWESKGTELNYDLCLDMGNSNTVNGNLIAKCLIAFALKSWALDQHNRFYRGLPVKLEKKDHPNQNYLFGKTYKVLWHSTNPFIAGQTACYCTGSHWIVGEYNESLRESWFRNYIWNESMKCRQHRSETVWISLWIWAVP